MAISFDATTGSGNIAGGATTASWTHTPVGTPTLAVVKIWEGGGNHVSSITYGGNAMTFGITSGLSAVAGRNSIYYLPNPPSGAQTVTVNKTAGDGAVAVSDTYLGTDATVSVSGGTGASTSASSASSYDTSITIAGTGSWVVASNSGGTSGTTGITGGGATFTAHDPSGNAFFWDSNGTVASGSDTMTASYGGAQTGYAGAFLEIKVASVLASVPSSILHMMGVG